ncbi:isochorismatase family protein [Lentisphaerota bacterium WC36G]|nr:isochorismatase family protein [Lentisphaerae bacterium WC36]
MTNLISPFNEEIAVVLIDAQEKLMPAMVDSEDVIKHQKMVCTAAKILNLDIFITEQYPQGLGSTVKELAEVTAESKFFEKVEFSCLDNEKFAESFLKNGYKTVVLMGVESHICVQQTALAMLENNINVVVLADAVASRKVENKNLALDLMRQCGAFITSSESFLFSILKGAKHPNFRDISKLIK